ncbi:hypothetical protein Tco_1068818 [Tanacetum coccineum]|uniref:Integrase, catalytic region, zinc finger, CCHC-type, peptidase aspartic, catalytic n=1 Tax=Tanacetum coccineum TaxID=301880 RepID=A0ABQ5HI87_9ASTR
MTTLAEFMIIAGTDNRPPMLEKSLYDSWKSRMELYIENRENGIMILNSLQNGALVCPTIEENGTARKKKYEELSVVEKLQADCDLKATNIVLQGLSPDVYAIMNHHKVAKEIWDRVKLLMQGTKLSLQEKECKLYDEFDKFSFVKGETLYQYYCRFAQLINNMNVINMSMRLVQVNTNCRFFKIPSNTINLELPQIQENQATYQEGRENRQEWLNVIIVTVNVKWLGNVLGQRGLGMLHGLRKRQCWLKHRKLDNDEEQLAFLTDPGILDEVPHSDSYHNDMDNQCVHAMQDFEQTPVIDFSNNEIHSDSNIISYSQYLQETQQVAVQDTNVHTQQDLMILSMIEQMSEQIINHVNNWEKANQEKNNESLTVELERYKE